MEIKIEVQVNVSITQVWDAWINPEAIVHWNFASDEWCCPKADVNLAEGQTFNYRMEAKDGSMGFDFIGKFTKIVECELIHFELEDEREVTINFLPNENGVQVIESFEAENENTAQQQKDGWQSILNNFKKYVEHNETS